jgi:hypothetical protein
LAHKVLNGTTREYRDHPQLARCRAATEPPADIASYSATIVEESRRHGYKFDASKVPRARLGGVINATEGQLRYE